MNTNTDADPFIARLMITIIDEIFGAGCGLVVPNGEIIVGMEIRDDD